MLIQIFSLSSDGFGVPGREGLFGAGECQAPELEAGYFRKGPPSSLISTTGEAHPPCQDGSYTQET